MHMHMYIVNAYVYVYVYVYAHIYVYAYVCVYVYVYVCVYVYVYAASSCHRGEPVSRPILPSRLSEAAPYSIQRQCRRIFAHACPPHQITRPCAAQRRKGELSAESLQGRMLSGAYWCHLMLRHSSGCCGMAQTQSSRVLPCAIMQPCCAAFSKGAI